tara:strand:- start:282 stop:494 length:213 start_codon:yes stop_codon:yes gene_type:complete
MTIEIDYGSPCDSNGSTRVLFEVNSIMVETILDMYGKETFNPLLAIDYVKDGEFYDIMAGDIVSISIMMS